MPGPPAPGMPGPPRTVASSLQPMNLSASLRLPGWVERHQAPELRPRKNFLLLPCRRTSSAGQPSCTGRTHRTGCTSCSAHGGGLAPSTSGSTIVARWTPLSTSVRPGFAASSSCARAVYAAQSRGESQSSEAQAFLGLTRSKVCWERPSNASRQIRHDQVTGSASILART